MNSWNIPDSLEREVRARDKKCVYCGVEMLQKIPHASPRNAVATWEHIINDVRITTRENIALCCWACNSSKGEKALEDWLRSTYCLKRGVTESTVADIVKDVLATARKRPTICRESRVDTRHSSRRRARNSGGSTMAKRRMKIT